jgi:hypothetical protein
VLVLAEAVEALIVAGVEQHLEVMGAAAVGPVASGRWPGEVWRGLGQQFAAVGTKERELAGGGYLSGDVTMSNAGMVCGDVDRACWPGRAVQQGSRQAVLDGLPHRAPHSQAAGTPGFDAHGLVPTPPFERRTALREHTHSKTASPMRRRARRGCNQHGRAGCNAKVFVTAMLGLTGARVKTSRHS